MKRQKLKKYKAFILGTEYISQNGTLLHACAGSDKLFFTDYIQLYLNSWTRSSLVTNLLELAYILAHHYSIIYKFSKFAYPCTL